MIERGDIEAVTELMVEGVAACYSKGVDCVIVRAGSPCRDLSSLRVGRNGLACSKSQLLFEFPRVFKLIRSAFAIPVLTFVENVASMSRESQRQFTTELVGKPLKIEAAHFTQIRRNRLYRCRLECFMSLRRRRNHRGGGASGLYPA